MRESDPQSKGDGQAFQSPQPGQSGGAKPLCSPETSAVSFSCGPCVESQTLARVLPPAT
jgi:hypothetical protein